MKHLVQFIALNLFGLDALQILAAIGGAFMLLQAAVNKFSGCKRRHKIRKQMRAIENNMWAIE